MDGYSPQFILTTRLLNYVTLLLRNVQQGQSNNVIVKQGGDLFDVAATVYGNVGLAFQLASSNGLIVPIIAASVTEQIVLPPIGVST